MLNINSLFSVQYFKNFPTRITVNSPSSVCFIPCSLCEGHNSCYELSVLCDTLCKSENKQRW